MTTTPVIRGHARDAIVAAATGLFNAYGIKAVSADRVIESAGCSKVTFYRHFRTKDDLVVAYLTAELERLQAVVGAMGSVEVTADDISRALIDEMCQPGFRGCPFINAAAEYPDPDHPVRGVVDDFREWMRGAIAAWLSARGVVDTDAVARQVMMLRDGALVEGYVSRETDGVIKTLASGIDALVAQR